MIPDLIESMKLRNAEYEEHGGWPTVRMTEINSLIETIESQSKQLEKANERVKELENAILDSCSTYHFEPDLSQPASALKELLKINSKWTLDPEISSDADKFAIEKKIEALESLKLKAVESIHKNWIVNPMNGVERPGIDKLMQQSVGLNTNMIDSEIEQLRKGQE